MNIITGMHRSGTSAVARLFYEHGADLGDKNTFYPPDIWNTDGYFEQPDIHAINMPLINGPWGKLAYFNLPSEETILKRANKINGLIASTARKYDGKIVKETRFCLTLKAWQVHNAHISKILVCLREPIESACSISTRNKIPVPFALKLWHEHYRRLLGQIAGMPVWYIRYNHLLNETLCLNEIRGAFYFMGFQLTGDNAKRLCQAAIKPTMNHFKNIPDTYPHQIETLWRELTEKHEKQHTNTTKLIHDSIHP